MHYVQTAEFRHTWNVKWNGVVEKESSYWDPRMMNSTQLKSIRLQNIMMPSYLWRVTNARIHVIWCEFIFFRCWMTKSFCEELSFTSSLTNRTRKNEGKKLNYVFFSWQVAYRYANAWNVCLQKKDWKEYFRVCHCTFCWRNSSWMGAGLLTVQCAVWCWRRRRWRQSHFIM